MTGLKVKVKFEISDCLKLEGTTEAHVLSIRPGKVFVTISPVDSCSIIAPPVETVYITESAVDFVDYGFLTFVTVKVGSTQQIILVINVVKFVRLVVTSVRIVLVVILVII